MLYIRLYSDWFIHGVSRSHALISMLTRGTMFTVTEPTWFEADSHHHQITFYHVRIQQMLLNKAYEGKFEPATSKSAVKRFYH